jgi:hypothetical protein
LEVPTNSQSSKERVQTKGIIKGLSDKNILPSSHQID